MGFIKTDPNQSKAVIPLIAILVGAVVITVMRINPGPAASVAASTASVSAGVKSAGEIVGESLNTTRNPFKNPGFITAAVESVKSAIDGPSSDEIIQGFGQNQTYSNRPLNTRPFDSGSSIVKIAPMPVPRVEKTLAQEPERLVPVFSLLATIKDSKGYCAVVKTETKSEQVVEVGDILEGGFKVKQIDADHAVLTNGRDIVIAKRPNS